MVPLLLVIGLIFFSSRRRHTRSLCDWSSDVCSSDLTRSQGGPRRSVPAGMPDTAVVPARPRLRRALSVAGIALWLTAAASGLAALTAYAARDRKSVV